MPPVRYELKLKVNAAPMEALTVVGMFPAQANVE
jgi:hypothetical protein